MFAYMLVAWQKSIANSRGDFIRRDGPETTVFKFSYVICSSASVLVFRAVFWKFKHPLDIMISENIFCLFFMLPM